MPDVDTIPGRKVAWSISRSQRLNMFMAASSDCLLYQHQSGHTRDCAFTESESTPMLHNYCNTCAKSLFAKPRWEFSVFNRPQNFSSLPWGEVLWFSSCTWGLHLNHLRSGVQYPLKAASILFRHTWIFFFLNFKVRDIPLRGKKALEMH